MIHVLLQTTIPFTEDDWNITRFSLLKKLLEEQKDLNGKRIFKVTARDLDRGSSESDSFLATLDESDIDQAWIFAVDVGTGINSYEASGINRFYKKGRGLLTARDHQDLGCSLCALDVLGAANYFHTKNLDPDESFRALDDLENKFIQWPNFHSGKNGDIQKIDVKSGENGKIHSLMLNQNGSFAPFEYFPAHPHEGAVGKGIASEAVSAQVIARGKSLVTGRDFNLAVAFEPRDSRGRGLAHSSFHHFVDYNWNIDLGAPSFVTEKPGSQIKERPELLNDIRNHCVNVAHWLTPPEKRLFKEKVKS